MDKFGIFNLLNSFFNLSGNKNSENNVENTQNGGEQPQGLNGFLSALNNGFQQEKPQNNTVKTEKVVSTPLQRQMLSTINAHDELIKRVTKKEKIKG